MCIRGDATQRRGPSPKGKRERSMPGVEVFRFTFQIEIDFKAISRRKADLKKLIYIPLFKSMLGWK